MPKYTCQAELVEAFYGVKHPFDKLLMTSVFRD